MHVYNSNDFGSWIHRRLSWIFLHKIIFLGVYVQLSGFWCWFSPANSNKFHKYRGNVRRRGIYDVLHRPIDLTNSLWSKLQLLYSLRIIEHFKAADNKKKMVRLSNYLNRWEYINFTNSWFINIILNILNIYNLYLIIYHHNSYGTAFINSSPNKSKTLNLSCHSPKDPKPQSHKKPSKKVSYLFMQLYGSKKIRRSPNSKSEEEDICLPLLLTSQNSPKDFRIVWMVLIFRKLKSKKEELLLKRQKNDY